MTKDRYFEMCEQLGKDPIESEIPIDWEDFPEFIQTGLYIFNLLGDRVYPEIGYIGKDYTNLPVYIDSLDVEDTELLLELLYWLDQRAIKKNTDTMKKAYDKIKRKSNKG